MKFEGTPGPWFVEDGALGNKTHVVLSKCYPFEMMSPENRALITAAPELLDALQSLLSAWRSGSSKDVVKAEKKARAAIAKAIGKEE